MILRFRFGRLANARRQAGALPSAAAIKPRGIAEGAMSLSSESEYLKSELLRSFMQTPEGEIDFDAVAAGPRGLSNNHSFFEFALEELYSRAELTVETAIAEINLRREAEAPDVPYSEYSKTGQARIDLVHSAIEAIRPILEASFNAYREMGLSDEQLWRFFEAETKFIFQDFPLVPDMFQQILKREFSAKIGFGRPVPVDDVPEYELLAAADTIREQRQDTGLQPAITFPVLEDKLPGEDGNCARLPLIENTELPGNGANANFRNRTRWLVSRLRERAWDPPDVSRNGGPDKKTIQKMLKGEAVRSDVLEKLAKALSKKGGNVSVLDIPVD
jgi:hypothetical protein